MKIYVDFFDLETIKNSKLYSLLLSD